MVGWRLWTAEQLFEVALTAVRYLGDELSVEVSETAEPEDTLEDVS